MVAIGFGPRPASRGWVAACALLLAANSVRADDAPPIPPTPPSADLATNMAAAPSAPAQNPVYDDGCWGWSDWANVPPLEPTPRAGLFTISPTGPGYYTFHDWLCGDCDPKPPVNPYRLLNYDNDFRYVDAEPDQSVDFFDAIKRIHLGDDWLLSIGGDERARYQDEHNGYLRITGLDNDYTLFRSRVYGDLWYQDQARVFVQFYDAEITGEDLPPQKIDVNKADFLDLFTDVTVANIDCTPVYVRVGRQELLYGSQRLISNLDWANTERTFQGVKTFWHSDHWDLDAFWVQLVVVNPTHFDSPNDKQNFAGAWSTYKPRKGVTWDAYYLYLDNASPIATGIGGVVGGNVVQTIGSRYAGDCNHYLWDCEGMYQFGDNANQNISAASITTGVGYQLAGLPANPQIWMYYDYATGSQHPGTGDYGTFNQLFPFGHYYFGYLDLVGRQNIEDVNWQLVCYPSDWITSGIQFHIFNLASSRDALYNAAGSAIAQDAAGTDGHHVGDEVDLWERFQVDKHQDVLVGYSHLQSGEFLRDTKHVDEIEFCYVQYQYRW